MSTINHQLPPTSLALQVRPLPAELMNRFDAFIIGSEAKVVESQRQLDNANALTVDSEAAFITMDVILATAKRTDKANEDERLSLTRPIDDFKQQFLNADRPAHQNYGEVVKVCTSKMSAFRAAEKQKALEAQREAERILKEQKERQDAEARKLEERAATLKTPARAEALMREADEIRQAAAMMPDSVALAVSAPATVASSVSEPWIVDSFTDVGKFLHWLADHPEWHSVLKLDTNTRPMQRFADQCHVLEVPGVKFKQKDVFRSKSR